MSMTASVISGLTNPQPILQQSSSSMTTNPFIPQDQRDREIQVIQTNANEILKQANDNQRKNIGDMSLREINKNMASSVVGFLDDLFLKPENTPWKEYLPQILEKDQRFTYFGVLLILVALYMLLTKQ